MFEFKNKLERLDTAQNSSGGFTASIEKHVSESEREGAPIGHKGSRKCRIG